MNVIKEHHSQFKFRSQINLKNKQLTLLLTKKMDKNSLYRDSPKNKSFFHQMKLIKSLSQSFRNL